MVAQGNIGLAFAAVTVAGLATAVGGSVVFFPSIVKLASRRVLAAGLGFGAGVMLYVSFVEVIYSSVGFFLEIGFSQFVSYLYAVLCFFCRVLSMKVSKTGILRAGQCIFQCCLWCSFWNHCRHDDYYRYERTFANCAQIR